MEKEDTSTFYSLEQLDTLITFDINDISESLHRYTLFQGMLECEEGVQLYADGYFIIKESEKKDYQFTNTDLDLGLNLTHPEVKGEELLLVVTGTKDSDNASLVGNHYRVKPIRPISEVVYLYDEFIEFALMCGIPLLDAKKDLDNKIYNYDTQKMSAKNVFTLKEACIIASNWYLTPPVPTASMNQLKLYNDHLDTLFKCIKGIHYKGFHLATEELWCRRYSLGGEVHTTRYMHGNDDISSIKINIEQTTISKSELLRWCDSMGIETGLTKGEGLIPHIIESPLVAQNISLEKKLQALEIRFKDLENENKDLKERLEHAANENKLLKENSFLFMTKTLKVMQDMQILYFTNYDSNNPPSQIQINRSLCEGLGLSQTGNNRKAAELANAIKPD